MWIKLKTLMAGPEEVRLPGAVVELPEAQARWLVDSGQAEEASPPTPLLAGEGNQQGKARAKARIRRETATSRQAEEAEQRGAE